jgi:hypothetical protein
VGCARWRDGCYGLARLINQRRREAKVIDWLDGKEGKEENRLN